MKQTNNKFILLDVNTTRRYLDTGSSSVQIKSLRMMISKLRRIFAWSRLQRVPILSIVSADEYRKPRFSVRHDHEIFPPSNGTDLPKFHDQLIFCNRCKNPLSEPLIDRILTSIRPSCKIIAIGIGEELVMTVQGLLNRKKQVTVIRDACRFPELDEGIELRKMQEKGAKIVYMKSFEEK